MHARSRSLAQARTRTRARALPRLRKDGRCRADNPQPHSVIRAWLRFVKQHRGIDHGSGRCLRNRHRRR
eukprot:5004454-Pleurochrysis_carterae.AAC.5